MTGKSNEWSPAPNSKNNSRVASNAHCERAPALSILLMTTIILWPIPRAFLSTKRVWGMGPSLASINSKQPSAMLSTRSTSPPKSAWPGVSMMLILISLYCTAAFLEKMVMPRSRSSSLLSMIISWAASSFFMCVLLCRKSASTKVVLLWSTWEIRAILRIFCISSNSILKIAGCQKAASRKKKKSPLLVLGALVSLEMVKVLFFVTLADVFEHRDALNNHEDCPADSRVAGNAAPHIVILPEKIQGNEHHECQ